MDAETINRLNLIKYQEKMIELAYELHLSGGLQFIYSSDDYSRQRKKLENFGITPQFNFSLWKKIKENCELFNYMKISKKLDLKQKWLQCIVEKIPEIQSILDESNDFFVKYKQILLTILDK